MTIDWEEIAGALVSICAPGFLWQAPVALCPRVFSSSSSSGPTRASEILEQPLNKGGRARVCGFMP